MHALLKTSVLSLGIAVLLCALPHIALAQEPSKKSLDDQLFDDLDNELLPAESKPKVNAEKPPGEKATPGERQSEAAAPAIDEKLLDQLGEGEDIELGPPPHPLISVGKRMRTVETLMGRRDTSDRTQVMQKRILAELDALLEQTKQQCQQCQNPSGAPKPTSSSQPMGSSQENKNSPPNPKPRDSTERLGDPAEAKVEDSAEMEELIKRVWGHLPDRVKGQLQNATAEQFLPKYEKLIEAYYKRLAEEPSP